jgi:uncharacterized membrane protein
VPWLLAALIFGTYATLTITNYNRFAAHSYDLGIFDEAVRQYATLHAPVVHIKGVNFLILGDHFSPLLAALAPVYRVFPSALTLEVGQAALFAISVVPITKLAMRHTSAARGIAIGAAYGIAWGLQQAVNVDFHEICLAVPLLACSLCALVDRRWRACVAWAMPLVLVKEDLGLTVAAIGVCVALRGRRQLGARLSVFGAAATTLTVCVVMPALSPTGHYKYWAGLTAGGEEFPASGLVHNLLASGDVKVTTLAMIFGITGFLALRSPLAAIALPTLAWRFVADVPSYWGTDWHYNAVLMPIVFVALVDATILTRASRRTWLRAYGQHAAPVALATAIAFSGQFPLATLAQPATYTASGQADAHRALAHIRSGTVVETDPVLMAHLTDRCDVYFITRQGNPPPDYLIVASAWMPSVNNAATFAQQLHPGIRYEVVYSSARYQVAQRLPQIVQARQIR